MSNVVFLWTNCLKKFKQSLALTLGYLLCSSATANIALMVAVDPSAPKNILSGQYIGLSTSLSKVLGQYVRVDRASNFAEVLRSTRTDEYEVFIVPGHVASSALKHGYIILSAAKRKESYVLLGRQVLRSVEDLKGKKLYLPQQDSIHAFMAKGLLNESGLSLKAFAKVQYQSTTGAGLLAVRYGLADATVVERSEYDRWSKENNIRLSILTESKPVPSGMAVLAKRSLSAADLDKLQRWALDTQVAGLHSGDMEKITELALNGYKYLAELGNFTPNALKGVTRVSAREAADLISKGAQMVDVRSQKEYVAKRIQGALLATYVETSSKDVSFDATLDDFRALATLDKKKPIIFACNGAECWKSYKASAAALNNGFEKVYWLRGGLPEWEEQGLPLDKPNN